MHANKAKGERNEEQVTWIFLKEDIEMATWGN